MGNAQQSEIERHEGGEQLVFMLPVRKISFSIFQVENLYDLEYVAVLSLGTPKQELKVILGTGSAGLWVPGIECTTAFCSVTDSFNSNASSTLRWLRSGFSNKYGDGSETFGYYAQDVLYVGFQKSRQKLSNSRFL